MTFAERLRQLRQKHGMSMADVAKHLGVGRANIYKYEHGIITNIPQDKVNILASLFQVSPAYLMGWSDDARADMEESVPIPDSETFLKAYSVMDHEDRRLLTEIFIKANAKLEEIEWKKKAAQK